MSVAKNHSNIPYYIKCALGLFFMFGAGRLIAPPLGLPAVGWQVLCIFFGLIWLWSIAEIIWPSILGVVALGMSDYCTMDDAILNALGQSTVWQMIMCMMLIGAINESGCGTTIANRLLTLKFTQGKPMLFVWTLLVGFMSISVFIGFLAGALLSWGIIYNIAEQAGYKKGDKFLTLFVIADFLATNVGTTVLPFRGVKLALLKAFSNITGNEVDYLTYILFTYGSGLLLITSFVFLMRYVFRADFSKLKDVDTAKVAAGSRNFTTEGKIYMSAFGVILVYILICNFISLPGALWAWFISVGSASIFALVVGLLSMVKYKGNSLLNVRKLARNIEWNGVFICSATIQIASAVVADNCGILDLVNRLLTPIFLSVNGFLFVVAVVVVSALVTNVANNIAVGMLMLPLVMSFADSAGESIVLLGILITFTVQNAWMLPGASAAAALLHGNEYVKITAIYKYGAIALVALILILVLIMYPIFSLFV